ncbi:XRE family transcriptional regulator [Listeria booriae]|uniref:ImmA/IrrE family metallo-endopeptidase n=1 Tax=Listeria booriae TaxID=1552123 RepID=A0A841XUT0_9LIST|nr:XRE family transcriptional regulator [Listeria booriae]MBC1316526.1 ImmA/IrrE family metallo-endopeptidase [Listeria booriae]
MLHAKFNGDRLREARRFRSKSITELADALGVTKQMISKYENMNASPSRDVVFRMTQTLGFSREYFYDKDKFEMKSSGTFFRSRLTSTQKEKVPVEYVKKWAAVLRHFLEIYVDFPELPKITNIEMHSSIEEQAESLRDDWDIGEKPVDNLMRLLEEKGFVVASVFNGAEKVDAMSSYIKIDGKGYYIIILEGGNYSFYREQFSIAHELGHWLLHSEQVNPQELEMEEYKKMEQEANEFAANFLLPKIPFQNDVKVDPTNLDYYITLKRKWNVSIAMMVMRAFSLGIINSEEYKRMQRQLSYRGWRTNEPMDSVKHISEPIAMKQAVELLVENSILKGYEIPKEFMANYGVALPISLIEQIANVDDSYLEYKEPQIVSLVDIRKAKNS